jgi:WD40 repeat protein
LSSAEFSPDGKLILAVADQGEAVLWEAASGRRLHPLTGSYARMRGASWVLSAGFSPDGSRVALVDWHPSVNDAATGKPLFELEGHARQVRDIRFSPDGQWLVTAGEDRTARVWRAAAGAGAAVLPHDAEVTAAAFSPGSRWVLTRTAGDEVIRVWETGSWKQLSEIDIRPRELTSFASSPDGDFIVTTADAGNAVVFETRSGARVAELTGHAGPVIAARFGPDGRRIVTAGFDGRAHLYDFSTGGTTAELIALARKRVPRQLSAEERGRHLPPPLTRQAPVFQ